MAQRRLTVRPGMTGLWQVSGRSDLAYAEAINLDVHYVENWSMTADLSILWRTAPGRGRIGRRLLSTSTVVRGEPVRVESMWVTNPLDFWCKNTKRTENEKGLVRFPHLS